MDYPASDDAFFDDDNFAAIYNYVSRVDDSDDETSLKEIATYTYDTLNAYYQGLDVTTDAGRQGREFILIQLGLPSYLDKVDSHGYEITAAELQSFLARDTNDDGVVEFREQYEAAGYLVNPAFYDPDKGFFATRADDGGDGQVYLYDGGGLAPADPTHDADAIATVNTLNALDLTVAATLVFPQRSVAISTVLP